MILGELRTSLHFSLAHFWDWWIGSKILQNTGIVDCLMHMFAAIFPTIILASKRCCALMMGMMRIGTGVKIWVDIRDRR